MVLIDNDHILGSIIPDVLISKITLETSSGASKPNEVNPHLDLETRYNYVPDALTGILTSVPLKTNLINKSSQKRDPNFLKKGSSTSNAAPNRTNSEKLIVTIDLILKEKFDQGLIGAWFKNQDFSKYLNIKIVQSTKPILTDEISRNKNLLMILDKSKFFATYESELTRDLKSLYKKLNLVNGQNIYNVLDAFIDAKTLNIKNTLEGSKSSLTNKYTEINSNGETVTNFVFRVRFELPNVYPSHLSYFVFSFLDLKQLSKDYGMVLSKNLLERSFGKIVSDIVIDNSETVDISFIYTKENGEIWVGPIDEISDSTTVGITNDKTTIPLRKIAIGNSKIQDFRIFNDIKRLVLDFSVITNEILLNKLVGPNNNKLDIVIPDNIFSDISLTRDENANCRFFFAINFRKLLELNASFGRLFKNLESSKIAIRDSIILSLKLFRRRIKGSPEIGSSPDILRLFDNNQFDELLAISGEKEYKGFNDINNTKVALREVNRIHIDKNIEGTIGIRYFSGIDKTISNATDGYYIYGVEVEVEDGSFNFLLKRIIDLRAAKQKLQSYLNEALQTSGINPILTPNDSHIDFQGNSVFGKHDLIPGNFDPYVNKFTQNFINQQKTKYGIGTTNNIVTPWTDAVRVYLDNLRLFSQNSSVIDFKKWEKLLLFFVHPATGNPSGISELIDLIQILENNISRLLGTSSPTVISGYIANSSDSPSRLGLISNTIPQRASISFKEKTSIKSFKFTKYFNSYFNSNYNKNIGYDFLDVSGSTDLNNGLKSITGEEYSARVERETNHYFVRVNGLNPDITLRYRGQLFTSNDSIDNTSFSYLSPARIRLLDNFDIKRIGTSPTPTIDNNILTHLDFSIRNFNSSPLQIKNRGSINSIDKTSQGLLFDSLDFFSRINLEPILLDNNSRISLADVIKQQKLQNRPAVIIDPLIQDNLICNTGYSHDITLASINTSPLPILTALSKRLAGFRATTLNPDLYIPSSTRSNLHQDRLSISNFDIASPDSKINKLLQNSELHSSEVFFQGAEHHTKLEDALTKLPNQIKSLFLERVSPEILRTSWQSAERDPLLSQDKNTEFRLSYKLINTIQILRGFGVSVDGEILLRQPLWEPLTLKIYNDSIGDAILCRMKPYENDVLGIERDRALELPPLHEYFLIKPKQKAAIDIKLAPATTIGPILPPSLNQSGILFPILNPNLNITQGTRSMLQDPLHIENILQMSIRPELLINNIVKDNSRFL